MRITLIAVVLCLSLSLNQAWGLIIHAGEVGVAKFHRYDNQVHPYSAGHAWAPYILPASSTHVTPVRVENADQSITIIFSTLEELFEQIIQVSADRNQKIDVLNINAHGLPGATWFPATAASMKSSDCADWVESAESEDRVNYDDYYSPITKADIMGIRSYSVTGGNAACTTGHREWKSVIAKLPAIKDAFSDALRINFLSCSVGLGPVGQRFSDGLAALISSSPNPTVRTSLYLGLGDWSMPEGMGFWDYQNDAQLAQDNRRYVIDKSDRDIMQKGEMRTTVFRSGKWQSLVTKGHDFLTLDNAALSFDALSPPRPIMANAVKPSTLRIPGTSRRIKVR